MLLSIAGQDVCWLIPREGEGYWNSRSFCTNPPRFELDIAAIVIAFLTLVVLIENRNWYF